MLVLLVVFVPFFLGVAGVCVMYYVAFIDVRAILSCLKSSEIVILLSDSFGGSKSTFGIMLSGSVIFPSRHINEGTLIPEELAAIPKMVMFRIRVGFWLLALSAIWLLVSYLYVSMR